MMISSPEAENGNMDKDKDRDEDTVAGMAAVAEQARRRGQEDAPMIGQIVGAFVA